MPARSYIRAIHSKFDYLANWLPNTGIAVGDVGVLTEGGFRKETSLKKLRLGFGKSRSRQSVTLEHTSGAEISVGGRAQVGDSQLTVGFGEAGGFVLAAKGCQVTSIADFDMLQAEILQSFLQGIWKPNWTLVDTVVTAERTTIIVSPKSA